LWRKKESALALSALALNCTLKRGEEKSSTQKLLDEILEALAKHHVSGDTVRVVDLDVKPGTTADEGEGDDWPGLRARILKADILILGTPIWLGQPSSVAKELFCRTAAPR
jgi:multimeric flavodoxin WrbA